MRPTPIRPPLAAAVRWVSKLKVPTPRIVPEEEAPSRAAGLRRPQALGTQAGDRAEDVLRVAVIRMCPCSRGRFQRRRPVAGTVIDLIADAIATQEATNGMSPAAVVVRPTVLATIRKAKAVSGGEYVVDPLTGAVTNLHGTRVVSSIATPAATVWVANAAGVVIYRRGGITAEIGMNADDFQTNQRTMRVEERFATAVTRPSMLSKITLT